MSRCGLCGMDCCRRHVKHWPCSYADACNEHHTAASRSHRCGFPTCNQHYVIRCGDCGLMFCPFHAQLCGEHEYWFCDLCAHIHSWCFMADAGLQTTLCDANTLGRVGQRCCDVLSQYSLLEPAGNCDQQGCKSCPNPDQVPHQCNHCGRVYPAGTIIKCGYCKRRRCAHCHRVHSHYCPPQSEKIGLSLEVHDCKGQELGAISTTPSGWNSLQALSTGWNSLQFLPPFAPNTVLRAPHACMSRSRVEFEECQQAWAVTRCANRSLCRKYLCEECMRPCTMFWCWEAYCDHCAPPHLHGCSAPPPPVPREQCSETCDEALHCPLLVQHSSSHCLAVHSYGFGRTCGPWPALPAYGPAQ